MEQLNFALSYLKYCIKAGNAHGLHSPFVFDMYNSVVAINTSYYCYNKIENKKSELLSSNETIAITDFGAGSRKNKSNNRKVAEMAKYAVKPTKYAQLLFRLANYFQPSEIIELGTSLGITTSYLASVDSKKKVITFEGCPKTAAIASSNFKALQLNNIQQIIGNFDLTFPQYLNTIERVDFVYIDGNHRKNPTLNYFQQLLPKVHNDTILIFDDIHWSSEMSEAWEEIKKHKKVTITVDFFHLGLVFFREEQRKENFILKF